MVVKREEQGAPVEVLELRTLRLTEPENQLLSEIMGNVQGGANAKALKPGLSAFLDWQDGGDDDDDDDDDMMNSMTMTVTSTLTHTSSSAISSRAHIHYHYELRSTSRSIII
jgi:hypothetical protein